MGLRRRDTVEGAREGVAEALQGRTIATPTARATPAPTPAGWSRARRIGCHPQERHLRRRPRPVLIPLPIPPPRPALIPPLIPPPSVTAEPVRAPNFDHIAGIAPLITPQRRLLLDRHRPVVSPGRPGRLVAADPRDGGPGGGDQLRRIARLGLGSRTSDHMSCVSNSVGGGLVGQRRMGGGAAGPPCWTRPECSPAPPRSWVARWTAGPRASPTEVGA